METQAHPKERILEVATRLFKERGFANVSVRQICQVAQVSTPMVYYYFKDKRGLFKAVAHREITLEPLIDRLVANAKVKGEIEIRLERVVEIYLETFPEDIMNAGFYLREKTEFDAASMKRFARDLGRIHELIEGLIAEGIGDARFRPVDPALAADCLLGMMNRFISQRAHFHRSYDPREAAPFVVDFALNALRNGP